MSLKAQLEICTVLGMLCNVYTTGLWRLAALTLYKNEQSFGLLVTVFPLGEYYLNLTLTDLISGSILTFSITQCHSLLG